MSSSLYQLTKANTKIIFRNPSGFFWNLGLPAVLYIGISLLPVESLLKLPGGYSHFLLPGIIAMTIMQHGIYSLAYWMVDLKSRGVLKRLAVSPVKKYELVLSLLLSRSLVFLLQTLLLIAAGWLVFGVPMPAHPLFLLLSVVAGGWLFLLMGLIISTLADTYESTAPFTTIIGLPLNFLGNIFYPLTLLPVTIQKIAAFLPIVPFADLVRSSYTGDVTSEPLLATSKLAVWFAVLLALAVYRLRNLR